MGITTGLIERTIGGGAARRAPLRHDWKEHQRDPGPILKWPGGKRWLVKDVLAPLLPAKHFRLFEPFAGGAALFFMTLPQHAVLSDINDDLINCYRWLRNRPISVLRKLETMGTDSDSYYRIRTETKVVGPWAAARIIYLTKMSFNGIYRTNKAGTFNVPYCGDPSRKLPDREKLLEASRALKRARVLVCDFEVATRRARRGDVVYFDPPYATSGSSAGFLKYNPTLFSWADQERLAKVARKLAHRGCQVMVSNNSTPEVAKLYKDATAIEVTRVSRVAAASTARTEVRETLYVFHP